MPFLMGVAQRGGKDREKGTLPESVFVTDPKGELFEKWRRTSRKGL